MLLSVSDFCRRVESAADELVDQLAESTGRYGEEERHAWLASLPALARALSHTALGDVHVHFAERRHHAALEYQLPGAMSWCDVVLLGRHGPSPAVVVVELKHWNTTNDGPGLVEGLVRHQGQQELHPSDQVRGYVHYCQRFHSAIVDHGARVHGIVLMTRSTNVHPYRSPPNESLAANFPLYTMADEHVARELPRFLAARLTASDEAFARSFLQGTYRQDRGFMRQVGEAILNGDAGHFELLDNQRRAFGLCTAVVQQALVGAERRRRVIVVEGPPGSGKSAVAARLWATLVSDPAVPDGNVVLVTTSASQSSNLEYLVGRTVAARVGRGVARRASSFHPVSTTQLAALRRRHGDPDLYRDAARWRENLEDWRAAGGVPRPGAEDDACLVSLVYEAHALIDPGQPHGVGQFGFVPGFGPQAYHVMRCSRVAVFFMDSEQSFRARENTRLEQIRQWAAELGAEPPEVVSLAGAQFRCAGSAEYVAWVESLLAGQAAELNRVYASAWHGGARHTDAAGVGTPRPVYGNVSALPSPLRRTSDGERRVAEDGGAVRVRAPGPGRRDRFDFRVCSDPFEMEAALRERARDHDVRLLSTYSRAWKTGDVRAPHVLPAAAKDFCEVVEYPDGSRRTWSRIWNYVPDGSDYTAFVAGRAPHPISEDPLCEVGCTYAVRGFDFGYVGLLWLEDLVWRDGGWRVQLEHVHESGITPLVRAARREGGTAPSGPAGLTLLRKVTQAYRILLTRAIHGAYVWIKDEETRERVRSAL